MTNEQPWWARTSTLIAGVLLAIALIGAGVVWISADGSDDAGSAAPASPGASGEPAPATETSESACGLAPGAWESAQTPPSDARWLMAGGGLEAPSIGEVGPGETTADGVHECFARNPLGAVMAGIWLLADAEDPGIAEEAVVLSRVTGETSDAAFGNLSGSDLGASLLGYRFLKTPTQDEVDFEVLLLGDDPAQSLIAMRLTFEWEFGDWRYAFPVDGPEISRPATADDFTPWASPVTATEATAVPGLSRPAPAWASKSVRDDGDLVDADPPYTVAEAKWAKGYDSGNPYYANQFAGLSHAERHDVMTPDPALNESDQTWLSTTDRGQLYQHNSTLLAKFYDYSRAERDNVVAGLEPNGDEPQGQQGVTDCSGMVGTVDCGVHAAGDAAGDAVDKVTGLPAEMAASAFGKIAQQFVEAADWAVKTLLTAWMKYPDADVSTCYGGSQGCSTANTAAWMQANLHWLVILGMIASLMIGALRMAVTGQMEHGREAGTALVKAIVVALTAGTVVVTSMEAADLWSEWILDQVDLNPSSSQFAIGAWASLSNPALLILLALVVLITQLVQLALMVARGAMVVILCGILPLSASMTNTQAGKQWFSKSVAWLIAWILYKPVAALIYAAAIKMSSGGDEGSDIATQLSGIFLMVLAVFTLPALMRFLVPAVASASAGNAGAIAGTMVGGGLAVGAAMATGGGSLAASGGFASGAGSMAGGAGGGGGGAMAGGVTKSPSGAAPATSGSGGGGGGPSGGSGGGAAGSPPVVESPAADSGAAPAGADAGSGGSGGGDLVGAGVGGASASPAGASAGATSSGGGSPNGAGAGGGGSAPPTAGGAGGGAPGAAPSGGGAGGVAPAAAPSGGSSGRSSGGPSGGSSGVQRAAGAVRVTADQIRQQAAGAVERERQE